MVSRVSTVAFEGVEARPVDVQVQIASGTVAFTVVGLADKAVVESRERVRSALIASGLALPAKRITVNLAPADMPKEGSHYDLPIALAVMAAIGAIPPDALDGFSVIGSVTGVPTVGSTVNGFLDAYPNDATSHTFQFGVNGQIPGDTFPGNLLATITADSGAVATPEPATLASLAIGLSCAAVYGSRRRKQFA